MRFYLAAKYGRRDELRGYAEELQALGHEVTSRWLWEEPPEGVTDDGVKLTGDWDTLFEMARQDVADVRVAEILLAFTEQLGTPSRGGRHFETGLAFALSPLTFIVIGPREHLFHYLGSWCPTWDVFKERFLPLFRR